MNLDVRRHMFGFAVFDGPHRLTGQVGDLNLARAMADKIVVKARARQRKKVRHCMCCRQTFDSLGPHNRLCPPCSQELGSLDQQMVG